MHLLSLKIKPKLLTYFVLLVTLAGQTANADVKIIGVGTHFGQGRTNATELFNWLDGGPFNSLRDEMYWSEVEQRKGVFELGPKSSSTLNAFSRSRKMGFEPLLILSYGNQFYDGGSQPSTEEAREAFAKYAAWTARTTKGVVNLFEIWNEWNIGAGRRPPKRFGDPQDYVSLTKITANSIKEANPTATVIGGALGDDFPDWRWFRQAVNLGLLDHVDAISVHLYNYSAPISRAGTQEFLTRINRLNEIIREGNKGRDLPIYITEIGWPNHSGKNGVSLRDSANQAQIMLIESQAVPNLKGIWFYEFRDGGRDPSEKEHHFGLTKVTGEEKPISCSLRLTAQAIVGYKHKRRINDGAVSIHVLEHSDGRQIVAAWSSPSWLYTKTAHRVRLTGSYPKGAKVISDKKCTQENASRIINSSAGALELEVTDAAILIELPASAKVKSMLDLSDLHD